ncbi:zinc dependent phospholipase C family protein [Paenibacillus antri]|uniref:Zinc dependent phospholipase C family protein n=1 Tax=Paenibacillus antri TaxID=2582848 RepID=A0A5R9GGY1_9BACL|nr:zinc dependent phospholipase C family protein [Paenibacillus antri]TLS53440.1 zinc dependent phospholipase C family protein [Paenibacillus antri]
MPNVWTHSIYGEILLERLSLTRMLEGDPALGPLFRFGCQGPDPLFYHRFYPWMKKESARSDALGGLLHKSRCGAFLRDLLRCCDGAAPNDPRAVYALGWLAHHALDRIAHPFVFARQGDRKRDHQRLETAIDTYVAERLRGIDTLRVPVRQTLDAGKTLPGGVAKQVEDAVRRTYPEYDSPFLDGLWQQSYNDMLTAFSLFHDPSGLKTKLLAGAIEPFVPGRRDAALDPMNDRRAPWRPPADKTKTSQESFWDVWERALGDGERLVGAAAAWLAASRAGGGGAADAGDAWRAFEAALGDLSYETGLAADR